MGQKVNPIGLRLGINRTWDSRWYAKGGAYTKLLSEDLKIKSFLKGKLQSAAVSRITIERPAKVARVTIYSARPGIIIGRKGSEIDILKKKLVAENVAEQLVKRIEFRRAMKRAVQSAMRAGAQGIRINAGGRLGGAEIARVEWYREGRVPLHTLRADIDYGVATAATAYGNCGIKVWIFRGELMEHDPMAMENARSTQQGAPR